MKELLIGIFVAGLIASGILLLGDSAPKQDVPTPIYDAYVHWKQLHQKTYSQLEDSHRALIFQQNWEKIQKHNNDPTQTYRMAPNQFMDLTPEEFKAYYLTLLPQAVTEPAQETPKVNRPSSWDWRTQGQTIRPVRNQGNCGSCWAFSAVGALEALETLKQSKNDIFSPQQLVDCSRSYGNQGCNGGLMTYAFQYVRAKGICLESEYPYVAKDQTCKKDGGAFKISGFTNLPAGNINSHADTCYSQPVSIAADASNWSFYAGGIFSNCGSSLNHGILLVGYVENSHWIVKNSWGGSWGEQGYIRLKWGNTCGCCNMSTIPNI